MTMSSYFPNPSYDSTCQKHAHYLEKILKARVYDVAIESPLDLASNLSEKLGVKVLLKREDLQPVFSFKLRGAFNRIVNLSQIEKDRGIIACSAGNHAQGVALASFKLGISATIVMPSGTPEIKDFDEAKHECARLSKENGMTVIHPFDDPDVIAGQGTIAMEISRQADLNEIDAIFVCVGGGGLASGIACYIKRLKPEIKIIGVETYDAGFLNRLVNLAGMTESLQKREIITLSSVGLFADGAAVRQVGENTFGICKDLLDGTVLVSTDEVCAAIKDTFDDTRSILEPAGALAVAGLKKYVQENYLQSKGKTFIATCSGANMNFDRLRFVAERADLGENREVLLSVKIPEKSGSFLKLYKAIHPRSVTEFSYRFGNPKEAHIVLSFLVSSFQSRSQEIQTLFTELEKKGMQAIDVSSDEVAKSHTRYLVGGKTNPDDERVFRFSFPERPGALNHFLDVLTGTGSSPNWNVSLFHYRNYGGDVGKVMAGIQVPKDTTQEFESFLSKLNYPFVEETENQVYKETLKQSE